MKTRTATINRKTTETDISVTINLDGAGKYQVETGIGFLNHMLELFSKQMEKFGAGELLVNSLDRDGTKKGFDIELLKSIAESVNIPVIASSGAGSMQDFLYVFQKTNVDAALGASIFHYQEVNLIELKKFLFNNNLPIRI